jgi:tetratricopeptide (TPR) repeat protein
VGEARSILPTFIVDAEKLNSPDDCQLRLHKALYELTKLSLITHHEKSDSYSMHPLVHAWVRERPKMRTRDQAVWCEAATTTLLRCILLPPSDKLVESHADLSRRLLPHIVAVEKQQEKLRVKYLENRKLRWKPWPIIELGLLPQKVLEIAKASLVYSTCGNYVEAEVRQRIVQEYVYRVRGPNHPRAIDITLALCSTLWLLSRSNEAGELLDQLLTNCRNSLGKENPRTLKVMDLLGETRRQQGRFTESLDLHTQAVEGMEKLRIQDDAALYHAMEHLSQILYGFLRFEEALVYQERAISGLKRILGEKDLRTVSAIELLATTYMELGIENLESDSELGRKYLKTAHQHILFVIEERTKQLGDKQPFTWQAKKYLGRIKSAMGDVDEAEELIGSILPMAIAHLGHDHLGVLVARIHYAQVLVKQGRFVEAEITLLEVADPANYVRVRQPLRFILIGLMRYGNFQFAMRRADSLRKALRCAINFPRPLEKSAKKLTQTGSSNIFWGKLQN